MDLEVIPLLFGLDISLVFLLVFVLFPCCGGLSGRFVSLHVLIGELFKNDL